MTDQPTITIKRRSGWGQDLIVSAGSLREAVEQSGANLARANLDGANLDGAKISDREGREIIISRPPLQLSGLHYPVLIWDAHMKIGCEMHSLAEWAAFDDRRILEMDGRDSAKFWAEHKDALLGLARSDGRSFEPVSVADPVESI